MTSTSLRFWFVPFLAAAVPCSAQLGPLNWTAPIQVQSSNIFLLWHDNAAVGDSVHQKLYVYNYNNDTLPPASRINATPKQASSETGNSVYTDVATGHFTSGPRDNVVAVWGPDATGIHIMLPSFDTTAAGWSSSTSAVITGNILPYSRIYVRTLDIDGDSLDEFVVSYMDNTDSVHLDLYDVDSLLQPTLIASYCDKKVTIPIGYPGPLTDSYESYALETGDFNGDGTGELALLTDSAYTGGPLTGGIMFVGVEVYDFVGGAFVPKVANVITTIIPSLFPLGSGPLHLQMCAVSGNYMADGRQELGFIRTADRSPMNGSSADGSFGIYASVISFSSDLLNVNYSGTASYYSSSVVNPRTYLSLSADNGDLTGDGRDEMVAAAGRHIFRITMGTGAPMEITSWFNTSSINSNFPYMSADNLKLTDVDQDGRPDIVVTNDNLSSYPGFVTTIWSVDTTAAQTLIGELAYDEQQTPSSTPRPFAIAVGSYDGLGFTIGAPTHHVAHDVVQPVVILNAPPVHFDVLNGQTYDLNTCYNGGDCAFSTTYDQMDSSIVEVSSTVESDWAISAGISASGSVSAGATVNFAPLGVGGQVNASVSVDYEHHMLASYGAHFSNTNTSTITRSADVSATAIDDDVLLSTLADYDVWEYPLYHGNETFPRSTILTIVPLDLESTWYPSKSFDGVNHAPEHEVGNVMSYPNYTDLVQNPNVGQIIGASPTHFNLNGTSHFIWNVGWGDFQSSSADASRAVGMDIGSTFGGFQAEGNFNGEKMHSQTNSVSQFVSLTAQLGHVDPAINAYYKVTPYAYWDTLGALVMDYAVEPEVASPGYPQTWWQTWYDSLPDPTFILPWLLDPEKGFAISEPAKRDQSKDIHFSPAFPLPGDTLSITVRVRNFSLVPISVPVSVSYYLGDPDVDGVPIIGLMGTNTIYTDGAIPDRGHQDVTLRWVVPEGLQAYPRVYAVLDEGDEMAEVHEGNNVGFNVLGSSFESVGVAELPAMSGGFGLGECYPNPFSSITSIDYSLTSDDRTTIQVFDEMGKVVATVLDKRQHAGTYTTSFDGSGLPAGLYILTIRSGAHYDSRRMVITR